MTIGRRAFGSGFRSTALAVACTFAWAGFAHADDSERENTKALCTDRDDNDGDGLVDCADPDCHVFRICQDYAPPPPAAVGGVALDPNGCPEPRREIQSIPKAALGGSLIPIGLIMLGGSIPLFLGINYSTDVLTGRLPDGSTFTTKIGFGYQCSADVPCNTAQADAHSRDIPYLVGGLILSLAGIAAVSTGAYLLYTGLQPKRKRMRAAEPMGLVPGFGASSNGMTVGLSGSF